MSSPVSGGLSNMSAWVTFEDLHGTTRIFRRDRCSPSLSEGRQGCCVVVEDDRGIRIPVYTKLTYDEIFA